MSRPYYLFLLPLILLLGGSVAPTSRQLDPAFLSGNISLTLKHGLWKLWEDKPVYQDITLDLVCDAVGTLRARSNCSPQIWGYSSKFNQDVDHQGTVKVIKLDNGWQLQVNLNVKYNPWQDKQSPANYTIEIIPYKNGLLGNYTGKFNDRVLAGKVTGKINPLWPTPVANYKPVQPQEHPRLIFRKEELPELRKKAKTPEGQAILTQLKKILSQPIYYQDYVPTGGYHAAGYCFLSLLNEDKQAAKTAWQIVDNSLKKPGTRILEQSPIVAGVALAYDLCYNNWSQEQRDLITRWLYQQSDNLIKGDSPKNGWNSNAWSNWSARARGAAGLAALAVIDEPILKDKKNLNQAIIAERNIKRYLSIAIGNRGFGTEGDHYTTEPLVLTVIPFIQANRNVRGQDLVKGSSAEWFLPHYLTRIVPENHALLIPTYGRHRRYAGGSLFAMGLGLVPQNYLPGIMWLFNRHLGIEGDKSFGINSPQEAIFVLVGYPVDVTPKNPIDMMERVLVDEQKGFYVFRNQWRDDNDFVASIYLKSQPLGGSWSFPDVGSFRIWGLGGHWSNPGYSDEKWEDENTVTMSKTRPWKFSQPVVFQSLTDGSGIISLITDKITISDDKKSQNLQQLRSFAVDYSGAAGVPGLFVIVDQFIRSVDAQEFAHKTWVMNTEGEVAFEQQSFIIKAANGATMKGTFITPSPVKLSFEKTETGGRIKATGGNDFFVVMTVQKGKIPAVKVEGTGLNSYVTIGKQGISFQTDRIIFSKF